MDKRRLIAVLEIVAVFVLGHALADPAARALSIPPLDAVFGQELPRASPDYVRLASVMARVLLVQYACLLAVAGVFSWRRRGFPRLTIVGTAWRNDLLLALSAFAVFALPLKVLLAVATIVPLGDPPALWIIFAKPWPAEFWLFAAVGSFVLIPILEELFYRGYCQGRLAEDMPVGNAVLITSVLFVLTHSQYHRPSVLAAGTVVGIAVLSIGLGILYATTRSLLAPMLAHALIDVPIKPSFAWASLLAMILVAVVLRRQVAQLRAATVASVRGSVPSWTLLAGALIAAASAISLAWFPLSAVVAALVCALVVLIGSGPDAADRSSSGLRP